MKLLIKNAYAVCPFNNFEGITDIFTENGIITDIAVGINRQADRVIDGTGLTLFPSLCDIHVHFREPGQEYKETIETGCKAAAAGGFSDVCCMPNTNPVADNASVIHYIKEKAVGQPCRVHPIAAVTKGQQGKELTEMGELSALGAVAFSDDGHPVDSTRMMRLALSYASAFDALILSHCEDTSLVAGGVMNEGVRSAKIGLRGIPNAAEALMVQREILLASLLNTRVHICHISCRESAEEIRHAKSLGIKVTAETCPHYLFATDEWVNNYDSSTKVNPPLRTEDDREEMIKAIIDGTVDCIASDHAPHHIDDKAVEYDLAANGISGLETSFPLCYTALVKSGRITLKRLLELQCVNPARLMKLKREGLKTGAQADFVLCDTENPYIIKSETFKSKGKNTPFNGCHVYGRIKYTVFNGEIVNESI